METKRKIGSKGEFVFIILLIGAITGATLFEAAAATAITAAIIIGGNEFSKSSNARWKAIGEALVDLGERAQDYYVPKTLKEEKKKKKSSDIYAPGRPLPRDEDGVPIPDVDAPHTQIRTKGSKRRPDQKYPQAREFDAEGKPVKDIDFTDHGRPDKHPNPHQHKHEPNETGGTSAR